MKIKEFIKREWEELKTDILKFAKWLVLTNIGRLLLGFVGVIVGNMLQQVNNETVNNIAYYFTWVSIIYLVGYVLTFMAFAWIINPWREWQSRRKK